MAPSAEKNSCCGRRLDASAASRNWRVPPYSSPPKQQASSMDRSSWSTADFSRAESINRTMSAFPDDDFLLETTAARELYYGFARDLPIIDYHCHLSPDLMAADHEFRSITEIWLEGDHYKWRAMRAAGVPERLITG